MSFHVNPFVGSDQAIRYLLETFGEVGKEVVTVAPSFEMYWVNSMDAHSVSEKLEKEYNVLVHPHGNRMLKDYIRVSTGSYKAMEKFLNAFIAVEGNNIV